MTYSPPLTSGDADALLGGVEEPTFPDDDCLDGCWNGSLPSPPRRTRSFGPKKETDGGTVFLAWTHVAREQAPPRKRRERDMIVEVASTLRCVIVVIKLGR